MAGPSGQVSFPDYIESYHSAALMGDNTPQAVSPVFVSDIMTVTNALLVGDNPYSNVALYDPDSDLDLTQLRNDEFLDLVDSVDELTQWEQMLDLALSRVDDILPSIDSVLEEDIASFRQEALINLARSYNRVTATLFDINGVVSTSFPNALVGLELAHNSEIAKFDANRRLVNRREKAFIILNSVSEMAKLFQFKVQTASTAVGMQENISRNKILIKNEQIKGDTGLNVEELQWPLRIMQNANSQIASVNGVPVVPPAPTLLQAGAAGVATSLAVGIQVGTVLGSPEAGLLAFLIALGVTGASTLSEFGPR